MGCITASLTGNGMVLEPGVSGCWLTISPTSLRNVVDTFSVNKGSLVIVL